MPLFECEKCKTMENTALGRYWTRNSDFWDAENRGKALCSECAPATHIDDTLTGFGKWHGRFKKRTAKEAGYIKRGEFFEPEAEKEKSK
jgi:hypothetical protein